MKKLFLIFSLLCAGIAHAEDQLSKAIRESNVEKVEELVAGISITQLPYYCSLAQEIIVMRRDQCTTADLLCSMGKPIPSNFKEPKKYKYACLLCLAGVVYGFYKMSKAIDIKNESFKTTPMNDDLYKLSQKVGERALLTIFGSAIAFIGINIRVNGLTVNHINKQYENALLIKEILEKRRWGVEGVK